VRRGVGAVVNNGGSEEGLDEEPASGGDMVGGEAVMVAMFTRQNEKDAC